jgi:hypothetical protein
MAIHKKAANSGLRIDCYRQEIRYSCCLVKLHRLRYLLEEVGERWRRRIEGERARAASTRKIGADCSGLKSASSSSPRSDTSATSSSLYLSDLLTIGLTSSSSSTSSSLTNNRLLISLKRCASDGVVVEGERARAASTTVNSR